MSNTELADLIDDLADNFTDNEYGCPDCDDPCSSIRRVGREHGPGCTVTRAREASIWLRLQSA